jgi:alpha-tubulin suppressor-like RCC1 family protein
VRCWGQNAFGQLGNGSTVASLTPVVVSGLSDVKQVVISWGAACALTNGGSVYCWGRNSRGSLGLGNTTDYNTPQLVPDLSNAQMLSASQHWEGSFCALLTGGELKCWGANELGQLGIAGSTTQRNSPTNITVGAAGITPIQIKGHNAFHCVLFSDDSMQCVGNNTLGHLGIGTTSNRSAYVWVPGA